MSVKLRKASLDDANRLFAIELEANPNPWPLSRFERICAGREANTDTLILEHDGQPSAYAVCQFVLDEATLMNIAVAGQWRRRGLARELLRALITQLRAAGVVRCLLEVRRTNEAAIALYQSCGFALDGVREGYYRGPQGAEDALLMSLALEDKS